MRLRLLALAFAATAFSACFDFDKAYCAGYCDGGVSGGGGGGSALEDAGTGDAGTEDAGCGAAVQLVVVAPPSFVPNACSAAVRVQLRDTCGAPAVTPIDLQVSLSSSSATLMLFDDASCTTSPAGWVIGADAGELALHVLDFVPGMPTLTARATGLDAGVQVLTIGCGAGQRVCPGVACVPSAGCCDDTECTASGAGWTCDTTSHFCAPPPCTGFPANCTVFDDRTASGASRTITFDSNGYVPKCMRVSTFQDVTFSGSFSLHPLQQTCGPSNRQMTTTSGTSKVVRFPDFGTYGYRCANHPVFEQGAIRVP